MKHNILFNKKGSENNTKYLHLVLTIGVLLMGKVLMAQNTHLPVDSTLIIRGTVRDVNTKLPVIAAQIKTLNYEAAAVTDTNGAFEIHALSKNEVLQISAYEYNTVEYPVQGKQNLEINLYKEVFTGLYTSINNLTGTNRLSFATNSITGINKFENPTSVSVDDFINSGLNGNVRSIERSGLAGIGSSLFIRGYNSLNLNAQPLFIVDGVPWDNHMDITSLHSGFYINPLADIDINDIESISVIKDGASLYGSKGANGVILISTKRGVDMATKITVNAVGGITQAPDNFPLMNGDQFRIYATDLMGTMDLSSTSVATAFLNDDPTNINYLKYHNNTNWENEVYKQGKFQSYTVSVNGGDERALYNFSLGYTGDLGIVDMTNMQRLNTRFNADFFLSDKIDMGLNIGFTNVDRKLLDDGVNFYTSPTYLAMIKSEYLNPYSYTTSGTLTTDFEDADIFDVGNPNAIIENSLNTNKQYRLNLSIKPSFQLLPSLKLSTLFDYSLFKVKESFYKPILGSADQYLPDLGFSENVFKNQNIRDNVLFNDTRLKHSLNIAGKHRVNTSLGVRYLFGSFVSDYAEGHNSGSDQKRNLLNEEDFKNTFGINNVVKSLSYYANIDYSFENRYFLNPALSVDGSSKFGSETQGGFQMLNHSWGLFPSVNAAWLISSENFMAQVPFINLLKLRCGYSISGNDAFIDPYARNPYFSTIRFMDRANGLYLSNIGNKELQWETSIKSNVGFDINLLNNRLSVSADVYKNKTKDLLHLKQLPENAGEGYYWTNGGELSNKGFEFNTNVKVLNFNSLKWEMGASIGHYTNKIESLPDGDFTTTIYGAEILTSVGNPAGVFYGYKTNGILNTAEEATNANLKIVQDGYDNYFTAGDVYFVDFLADSIINENDKQIIGDPNPDFYGSFNSKVYYKNFSLEALFTFSYGNDVYNYLRSNLESGSSFTNQTTAMLNRWTYEGQETNQPKVNYGDFMGNSRFSDRWIEDGSYIKLKSLSLNYKVPIQKPWIDQLNVWVSVNNLLTLTRYLGRDPEFSAGNNILYQGIDLGLIPNCKSFFVGVKMNL